MMDTFTKKLLALVKAGFSNIFELPALKMVFLIALFWGCREGFAQSAGFNNTFIVLSLNGGANSFYDLNAATANTDFNNANLGTFAAGSSNLVLKGAEHNVYKCGTSDLTSTRLNYRIYPTASPSGSYTAQSIGYASTAANGCGGQDQQWSNTGLTTNLLTGLGAGAYTIEVYSDATVTNCCGGTVFASNSGNNYKATFTVSSIIWTEAGAATAWYTNTNWTPNTTSAQWLTGSVAEFRNAGTATLAGINMTTAPLSIGAIDITSARTKALTINNSTATTGTLTLNGVSLGSNSNVILRNNAASPNLLTIQNGTGTMNVALGNPTTNVIDAASTGGITISSAISGASRSITKIGTGPLTLSGTNTYSGGTIISGGTVSAGSAANLGDAAGAITLGSGTTSATLAATGSFTRNALNVTTSSSAGVIDVATSQTLTLAALNTASGTDNTTKFGKSGAGTLTLSGAGSYVGQTQIGQGTVIVSNNAGLGTNNSTTARGIDLGLNVGDVSQPNSVSVLATTGITVPQSIYVAPNTSGLIRTIGTSGANASATFSNEVFLDGTATLAPVSGGTLTMSGNIINTGGLNTTTGTTLLSGTNTYSGATNIITGTLRLGSTSALGSTAAATSITSGAVLDLNGITYSNAEALTVNGTGITSGGAIINSNSTGATYAGLITLGTASSIVGETGTINISNTGTITGAVGLTLGGTQGGTLGSILGTTTATGTLTKQGAGTWTLAGANTYAGATTISAGTLRLGNSAALGTTAAGTSITSGAALDLNGTIYSSAEALTVNGTGISNGGAIFNSSASGATYAGSLTLGTASSIVGGMGTIAISGNISGAFGLSLGGAQGGSISSIIGTGVGTLTKQDAGTWTLQGTASNTFTGLTTVSAGTLVLNKSAGFLAVGGDLTINSGATVRTDANNQLGTGLPKLVTNNGTYNLNNTNQKIALAGTNATATVTLGSGNLNIDNTATTHTYAGTITGIGGLTKTSTGIEILTNSGLTYTGTTTITLGEVRLNPSANATFASPVVMNGGTLGTTGITAGISWTSSSTLGLSQSSIISLATVSGSHILTFANSSGTSWTAAATLTITGWAGGYNGTSGTAGQIFIGNSAFGLSAQQLSQIVFSNGTSLFSAMQLSTGEIVASPNVLIRWTEASTSTPWYTAANWTPSTASGVWTSSNIAQFNNTGTASTAGIDMSVSSLSTGAIQLSSLRTRGLTIGSSVNSGNLTLNGVSLGGVANTILGNASNSLLTVTNNQTGTGKTMNLVLGNATENVVQITGSGGITIESVIQGAGRNLTKSGTGAGVLSLSGLNTYDGSTTINEGTLKPTVSGALPSTTGLIFANTSGAILDLSTNAITPSVVSVSGGGTTGGNIAFGAATTTTLTLNQNSNTTYAGAISGASLTTGGLVKTGTGTLTLSNPTHTFTGITTITAGELRLNPASNATFASQMVLNGGTLTTTGIAASRIWTSSSTLNLNGTSTINLDASAHTLSFAASNAITWNGGTLTINGWAGTAGSSGTGGKIFFGNSIAGLTVAQRARIVFSGYPGVPILLSTGELVPPQASNSFVWNGNTDGLWTTASNWTPSGPPIASDHVTIGAGVNNLVLSSNAEVVNLTINGDFSIAAGGSLSSTGAFTYSSGTPTFDCASSLNIVGSASADIPAFNYGNLNISGGPRVLASSGTINVCGTFTPSSSQTVTGSTLSLNGAVGITLPTSSYNNLNIAGGASGTVTLAAGATLTIDGNLSVTNTTTLNLSNTTSAGTINLAGNLTLTNGNILRTGTVATSLFNFVKSSGIQTITQIGGSVDLTDITMNVGNGTTTNTVQLLNSTFAISAASPTTSVGVLRVRALASLDFKTNNISGTAGFTTEANSNLITASTEPTGAFNIGTGLGSVQVSGTRTYNAGTNYTYNGSSDQYIGFSTEPTSRSIRNLTINTSGGAKVILNPTTNPQCEFIVDSTLTLTNGVLLLSAGRLYVRKDVVGNPGFGTSNMIVTNQGSVFPQRNPGQFRRYMPTAAAGTTQTVRMTLPLGDTTGTVEYTPIVFDISYTAGASAVGSPYIGFKCIDDRNPYDASLTDYMTRYWIVSTGSAFNNASTVSMKVKATYKNSDVVGNEALFMNRFNTATLQNTEDISSYTDPVNDTLFSITLDKTMITDHDLFGRKTVPLYYKSNASGKWQNRNNWLISSDINFVSPAGVVPPIPPNSANCDSITILSAHTITADTLFPPYSMDQALISGTLNVDSGAAMYYANGPASLDVNITGTLKMAGTSGQVAGSTMRFESTSLYHHATRANVATITASSIPTATWAAGSHCQVTGIRDIQLNPASLNQAFSNFTWDCSRQAFNYNALGNLKNVTGNLTINSTNGRLFSLTRTQPLAMNVGQNFNITGGNVLLSSGVLTGAASLSVAGDMSISSGSLTLADTAATTTAISGVVTGAFSVSGTGSLTLAGSGASGAGSLNFSVAGASNITSSSPSFTALAISRSAKAAVFNANGGLTQSGGTINIIGSTGSGTLNIADNQTLALNGGTLQVGSGGPGIFGTLNVGTNSTAVTTTALNLGGGSLLLAASSTGTLNLYGDLNLNSGTLSQGGGIATVNFLATGTSIGSPKTQTLSQTSGTVIGTIAFNVGATNSFTRLLLGTNINLGTGSSVAVTGFGPTNFSYLDFGSNVLSGLNFTQQNYATLATAHPDGFWTIAGGLTTGALQTTATRSLNVLGNFSYNGSAAQITGNALANCLSVSVMNLSGLTLSTDLSVSGLVYLNYFGQHGKLRLAGFNLNMGIGATFSGQSVDDYVVTDGSGYLSMPVSTSAVSFPVGNSTYNPIALTPGTGSNVPYRVRVIDGVSTPSQNDANMLINRYWSVTAPTAPANTITVVPQWSTGDDNAGYNGGSQVKVAYYGTVWTEANATQLGANPYTSSASFAITAGNLNSGVFFGIGKDGGFINSIVTYTWNGSISSSWTLPANWTPGTSLSGPLSTDNVVISSPGTNLLSITGSQSIAAFTVSGTGNFTIASGASLNVTGNISNSSSATPAMDCNSTFLISSTASQPIPAFNYGNLNGTGGDRVLASSGTIGVCGTFTTGAGAYTIAGSTVDFNGTGNQSINAINFHNLSISGARGTNSVTLPSGTVGIAGSFSPTASFSSGAYVTTGNTIDFNAAGAQTVAAFNYNNLTISGARTSNNVTLVNGGSIGIAGTFNPSATFSTGSFVNTGNTIDFNSASAQTIPVFGFYNNLSNSNNGARTLANGIIKISGTYTPTSGSITIGTSTVDFAGAAAQVIPASFYYNITNSSNTDRTLASSGIIDINAGFTPTNGTTTISGSTVRYSSTSTGWNLTTFTTNVAGRQYNNLTFAGTGGSWNLNGNTIGVNGNLTVTAGTLEIVTTPSGIAATLNVDGNLNINGGAINLTRGAQTGTINLFGNFVISSGTISKTGGTANFNFYKTTGTQTFNQSGGAISSAIAWNFGDGSSTSNTIQFTSAVSAGTGVFNVNSGTTVDFGTNTLTVTTGAFNLNPGATLNTSNAGGITTAGATGSILRSSGSNTFSASANYIFGGAITGSGFTGANNLTINNTSGVTLTSAATVNGILSFTSGLLDIAAVNLTIGVSGSISGASTAKYVKTSGAGQLKMTVAASNVLFPVGRSAYNPLTLNNSGTSDVFGVVLADAISQALNNSSVVVNRSWNITETVAGGSNLSIVSQWNGATEQAAGFAGGTTPRIAYWNGSAWVQTGATQAGANPFTFTSTANISGISPASYSIAIGKDDAFNCTSVPTVSLILPTSGYSGDVITINGTGLTGLTSATIGGTAATVLSQSGTSATLSVGTGATGVITVSKSALCSASGSQTFTYNGYISAQTGNWSLGSTWQGGVVPPDLATVTIANSHVVTVDDLTNPASVTINAGAELTGNDDAQQLYVGSTGNGPVSVTGTLSLGTALVSNGWLVCGTLSVNNGGIFNNNCGNAIAAGANITSLTLASGATYNHNALGSTLNGTLSDFPGLTGGTNISINSNANVNITRWAQNTGTPSSLPSVSGGQWGNLTVNISGLTYLGSWQNSGIITNATSLNIVNTGTRDFRLVTPTGTAGFTCTIGTVNVSGGIFVLIGGGSTGSGVVTMNVTNDFNVSGGVASIHGSSVTQSYNTTGVTLNVGGNLNISGGSFYGHANSLNNTASVSSSVTTLNVTGNLSIDNATLNLAYLPNYNFAGNTGNVNLNVKGNFTLGATGFLRNSNSIAPLGKTTATVNFNHASAQQTWTQTGTIQDVIGFNVNGTANTLRLLSDANIGTSSTSSFNVANATTFDLQAFVLGGSGAFTSAAGSTLKLGNANGITTIPTLSGNVQMIASRTFNAASNYIYSGSINQLTGNGLPATITGNLSISNTGTSGNNTVSLTTSGTTASTLNLSSGLFAIGSGQNLNLASAGVVNATGGDFATGVTGGTITATGSAAFNGTSNPYNVYASGGVNFGAQTVTIQNGGAFRINSGGFVNTNAPFYAAGSTLEYNTGGNYGRGLEWNAASGRGYPHHVTVRNNTNHQPGANGNTGTVFRMGGDLNIQPGSAMYLDWGLLETTVDFRVAGSIVLDGSLSLSTVSGDLYVGGNWSRTGTFEPRSREVVFNGSAAQTFTGPTGFDYFRIINTSSGLTLNSGLFINQRLQIDDGQIILGNNDITLSGAAFITGGNASDYLVTNGTGSVSQTVNGGDDWFPVGPSTSAFGPVTLNQSGTGETINVRVINVAGLALPSYANAVNDTTQMVKLEWVMNESVAGANSLRTTFGWQGAGTAGASNLEGSAFDRTSAVYHGNYNSGLSKYVVRASNAITGTNPFFSLSTLAQPFTGTMSADQRFVVGNVNGILPCNFTIASGLWSNPLNWNDGLPIADQALCINHNMQISANPANPSIVTVNSPNGNIVIDPGVTLTLEPGGTFTNNKAGFNMTSGSVVFQGGTSTINGSQSMGLNNLQINGNTTLTTVPTINNELEIKPGGFIISANGPNYGASSTLKYNTGGSYNRSNEWRSTSGGGYPANVLVTGNTILNLDAGTGVNRMIQGNMQIDNGSSATQGATGFNLTVPGNFTLNGAYTQSTTFGGDLVLGGNWSSSATATLTANNRDVRFNGTSATQTIANLASGLEFGFLTVDNTTVGGVDLLNTITTNTFRVNPSRAFNLTSDKIIISPGGNVEINGIFNAGSGTIEYTNGGNFTNNGTFNRGTSTVDFLSTTPGVVVGSVQTNFHNLRLAPSGSVNFNSGALRGRVSGTFQMRAGSFCIGNAPIYEAGSKLMYSGGGTFNRNVEWDPSTVQKVEITNNTTLKCGTNGDSFTHSMADSLIIQSGSTFDMSGPDMTAPTIVGGNVHLRGTLTLSNTAGGDLEVAGDWQNDGGTFNSNGRLTTFNGSSNGSIKGSSNTSFSFLTVNKGINKTLTASVPFTISRPPGGTTLQISGGIFDLNGQTLSLGSGSNTLRIDAGFATGQTLRTGGTSITAFSNFRSNGSNTDTLGGKVDYSGSGSETLVTPVKGYNLLWITGAASKSIAQNTIVNDSLFVASGTTLTFGATSSVLEVRGNVVNNGTITGSGSGKVEMKNSSVRELSGNGTIRNLDINNAAGVNVYDKPTISNALNLVLGKATTIADTIVLGSAASISEDHSTGSYVVGNLKTTRSVNSNAESFGGMGIQLTAGADLGTVNAYRTSGLDGILTDLPILPDSSISWNWTITPSIQPSTADRNLTLSWPASEDNGRNISAAQIWKRSTILDEWVEAGGIQTAGGTATTRSVVWSNFSGFSQFTVGENNVPLALDLLSFTASKEKNYANVEWRVAQTGKASSYVLEKSVDNGRNYSAIETRSAGAPDGNYSARDYQFNTDTYYRIQVVNLDGSTDYSNAILLKAGGMGSGYSIYPNPATGNAGILLNALNPEIVAAPHVIRVFSAEGRLVIDLDGKLSEVNSALEAQSSRLPNGVYQLRLQSSTGVETIRFIKN